MLQLPFNLHCDTGLWTLCREGVDEFGMDKLFKSFPELRVRTSLKEVLSRSEASQFAQVGDSSSPCNWRGVVPAQVANSWLILCAA